MTTRSFPTLRCGACSGISLGRPADAHESVRCVCPSSADATPQRNRSTPQYEDLDLDGNKEFIYVDNRDPDSPTMRVESGDEELWSISRPDTNTRYYRYPFFGDANGDNVLDVYYSYYDSVSITICYNIANGSDGTILWENDF